jgi:hypothetical protein
MLRDLDSCRGCFPKERDKLQERARRENEDEDELIHVEN